MSEKYQAAFAASINDRDNFWGAAAQAIAWAVPPRAIHDEGEGWFAGGSLNS